MITVSLYPRKRKHSGGWIAPDTRTMTREIQDHKFPQIVAIIGPAGPAGSGTIRFNQVAPAGTWIIPHGLGREPTAQVFLASGEMILPDVTVDATHITITHASPQAGFVLAA